MQCLRRDRNLIVTAMNAHAFFVWIERQKRSGERKKVFLFLSCDDFFSNDSDRSFGEVDFKTLSLDHLNLCWTEQTRVWSAACGVFYFRFSRSRLVLDWLSERSKNGRWMLFRCIGWDWGTAYRCTLFFGGEVCCCCCWCLAIIARGQMRWRYSLNISSCEMLKSVVVMRRKAPTGTSSVFTSAYAASIIPYVALRAAVIYIFPKLIQILASLISLAQQISRYILYSFYIHRYQ